MRDRRQQSSERAARSVSRSPGQDVGRKHKNQSQRQKRKEERENNKRVREKQGEPPSQEVRREKEKLETEEERRDRKQQKSEGAVGLEETKLKRVRRENMGMILVKGRETQRENIKKASRKG